MADSDPDHSSDIANPYKVRDEALALLGFASYDSYLRSHVWKAIRKRAIGKAMKCVRCLRTPAVGAALQVHHTEYSMKALSGADISTMLVVCQKCHAAAEQPTRKRLVPGERLRDANRYIASKPHVVERCWSWYDRNQRWLPHLTKPEDVRMLIDTYRQRATDKDGVRCLVCGEPDQRLLGRVTSANHPCCVTHEWGAIRAAARALKIDLTDERQSC